MGFPEESQCICNYDMKNGNDNNADDVATITSTKESRNNKRRNQNIQADEANEMACIEQNTIINLK